MCSASGPSADTVVGASAALELSQDFMRHGNEGNWHRRVARIDEGRENRLRKREATNDRPETR